jgi:hypothetical protein
MRARIFGDFVPRGLQSESGVWRARCLVERNEQEKQQSWTTNQPMAFDIFMLSLSLSPYAQHMDFTNAQHRPHAPHQQF